MRTVAREAHKARKWLHIVNKVHLNEKVGFIIPTTRTRTFSMSARRFSEVGAVQFLRRVGIGILLGWLGV